MRTTVELPPRLHKSVMKVAHERGVSMSAVIADLTARGPAQIDETVQLETEPSTGLPYISRGRRITAAEIAALI